jgi:hypothetical protein
MKLYFLLLFALGGFVTGRAQDTPAVHNQKLMQELNMDPEHYEAYTNAMKKYDQQLLAIHSDPDLSFEQRKEALEKLRNKRQDFISGYLNAKQRKLLENYHKRMDAEHHSAVADKRKLQVEKLRQTSVKQKGS